MEGIIIVKCKIVWYYIWLKLELLKFYNIRSNIIVLHTCSTILTIVQRADNLKFLNNTLIADYWDFHVDMLYIDTKVDMCLWFNFGGDIN